MISAKEYAEAKRDIEEGRRLVVNLTERGFKPSSIARILASAVVMTTHADESLSMKEAAEWFQAAILELDANMKAGNLTQ